MSTALASRISVFSALPAVRQGAFSVKKPSDTQRQSARLGVLGEPSLHSLDHSVKRNFKSVRNPPQADRSGIHNASFDAADIGTVNPALRRQFFLRNTSLASKFADRRSDCPLFEAVGRRFASAPLHHETSWCYVESHKPTAYMPHLTACGL